MKYLLTAILFGLLTVVLGCQNLNSAPTPVAPKNVTQAEADDHDAPRISVKDAKALYDKDEAYVIDTRSENAYETEHITGAVRIPPSEIAKKASELPKNKTIVVYCS
ncbi:MAG: rhodanese-like domain-containing protein [Pyrinomonadaceae bacterium]